MLGNELAKLVKHSITGILTLLLISEMRDYEF